uniref:F-box domain-containing protein n=1 Tax=Oryza glumipatula TaxID=40148 RepID=A0A0E0ASF2_9ORYZ
MDCLPNDVLIKVLRCLPARSLAASRCVSKEWCTIIDTHWLLLPHVLPHSVHGIFSNYLDHDVTHFFSSPSYPMGRRIDGFFGFLPVDTGGMRMVLEQAGHCNGLILYSNDDWDGRNLFVCNPATRRWVQLPPFRKYDRLCVSDAYLVFDPVESLHYEVLLIPGAPEIPTEEKRRRGCWV